MDTQYSSVCPYLMVNDIDGQIDFLKKVFEAVIREKLKTPNGETQYAEVKIGNVVIMLSKSKKGNPTVPSTNYVFVKNVDITYDLALQNGATEISKPDDKFYGIREAGVTDPEGNTWWIGLQLMDVPTKEMEQALAKREEGK